MVKLLCRVGGHVWTRLADTPAPKGWWYEHRQCERCGAKTRTLVASQEG
jgi:hypothetical protein